MKASIRRIMVLLTFSRWVSRRAQQMPIRVGMQGPFRVSRRRWRSGRGGPC
jgi:hypothetical protein